MRRGRNYLHRRAGRSRDVYHLHDLCLDGGQDLYRLVNFPFDGLNFEGNFLVTQRKKDDDNEQEIKQANEEDKTPSGVQVEAISKVVPYSCAGTSVVNHGPSLTNTPH